MGIRGGNPGHEKNNHPEAGAVDVPIVDVVSWASAFLRKTDYVVWKMDIEGAEHEIFRELLRRHLLKLVDVLAFECHPVHSSLCKNTIAGLKAEGKKTGTRVKIEGQNYKAVDSFSGSSKYFAIDPRTGK